MGAILAAVENSPMAIAVSYRSLEGARVNAINAVDGKGRTALARACHDGNFAEVLQLLAHPHIDISLEDDSGMSPIEWAIKHNHHACASLVRNEAYFRASHRDNAFQTHLHAELQCADAVFDERLFRQAVETDPSAAMKYLDQFASSDRYYYHFSQLDAIYGRKNVKSSALYAILNSNILPAQDEAKYVCLQHVVMQRILDIKWELFAERMYYFQLLIFGLMMTAMTMVIASSYAIAVYIEKEQLDEVVDEDSTTGVTIRLMFHLWSLVCIYCLVAKAQLRGLTPEYLYRLARWQHDGVWAPFDRNITIPSLSLHKSYAKWYLFKLSIVVTVLFATPWCAYIGFGFTGALGIEKLGFMVLATVMSTAGVLLVTALYFLLLEYREILGEDPWIHERRANAGLCGWLFWTFVLVFLLPLATPFMRRYKKYFGSWFNILQLLTYMCIVPFALLSILCLVPEFQGLIKDVYLCLGAFITLSLWMLSLQYLEVNKTAGYLLPMLMDALGDVWDFVVFYGVFQCGLTCAFYFIFQQKSDNYKTLWASFRTTYFVLYGDNNVDDFAETDLEGDRRVLDVKWELFGARKYYQQLLLYVLMIGAVLTTVTYDFRMRAAVIASRAIEDDEREAVQRARKLIYSFPVQLTLWLIVVIFAFFAFVHLRHLKPHKFTKLTRWMYDGKYVFDPAFAIPEAAVYKAKAKAWLLRRTILWTVLVATPIVVVYALRRQEGNSMPDLILAMSAFLGYWLIAFYFLHLEVQELLGEDPWLVQRRAKANLFGKVFWSIVIIFYVPITPFLMSYRKYYASFTNKLQVITYLCLLGPFFWLQLAQLLISSVNYGNQDWQIEMYTSVNGVFVCLGAFIILSLWMLSLQYLEVNKTAGYLLPIVKDVMGDVWDFLIFYGVFQCGLTCAYYFIFQQKSDSYKTLWASFRATYFVMYGENGVGDFNAKDDDKKHLLEGPIMHFGFILRMFHCAVMVVLLLNLLLAMMNKTVDRNWAKLQSRALASYARCVLRLETMLGRTEAARENLLQMKLPKSAGGGTMRNPVFQERVAKHEVTAALDGDANNETLEATVQYLAEQNERFGSQLTALNASVQTQMQTILLATQKLHRD
ncbi:hypothetical protein SDRG_16957 [Saprolegnia diclina VS20]|uniref:Uncharacterized protein n=1 Tax=Saprolegnia diclina (strain VS20) TaxID=1156394 RepID=T0PSE5_SAPDV|nr:hypothetical protein SDRG_16957 [Saprolegnia diclina VS20]EQC25166.1 hypothetical protein SDRG_16957 [Saprolegnia diclina VS20]|eukprot:XP_008621405.1 hypothetical protein SDRG_16957 [Saprolegnia diclina VS20]